MNNHDGFGPAGYALLDFIHVHVPGERITVDEYGFRARAHHRGGARNDREGWHDDFIAFFQTEGGHCSIQGNRAVRNRNAVLSPDARCELFLKLGDKRTLGGNPTRVNALVEILLLVAVERDLIDGNKVGTDHPETLAFSAVIPIKRCLSWSPA